MFLWITNLCITPQGIFILGWVQMGQVKSEENFFERKNIKTSKKKTPKNNIK